MLENIKQHKRNFISDMIDEDVKDMITDVGISYTSLILSSIHERFDIKGYRSIM